MYCTRDFEILIGNGKELKSASSERRLWCRTKGTKVVYILICKTNFKQFFNRDKFKRFHLLCLILAENTKFVNELNTSAKKIHEIYKFLDIEKYMFLILRTLQSIKRYFEVLLCFQKEYIYIYLVSSL